MACGATLSSAKPVANVRRKLCKAQGAIGQSTLNFRFGLPQCSKELSRPGTERRWGREWAAMASRRPPTRFS